MAVTILKQRDILVASLHAEPSDAELIQFEDDLTERVGSVHARGVVIDVTALSVLDSFATRTLREIASSVRLRGAEAVIVGIQPEVAFAMVQLGLSLEDTLTALDLEQGLEMLTEATEAKRAW
jgi:rsbT antagonist protein RsbS